MKTGIYLLCSLLSFQHPQQSLAHGGHLRNTSELMFTQQLLNHSFNQKSHTLVSTYTCICDTALPASGMFLYILYFMKEHKGRKDSYESLSSRNHKRIMWSILFLTSPLLETKLCWDQFTIIEYKPRNYSKVIN